MNDDRISEVYKGEIWSDEAQERARRRINWLCRNVTGDRVLDIGTSQGIVPILLGREGFEVTGVDIQPDRIEYAREDLSKENAETRERVTFLVAEGSSLDFPDESFDSIVLGEVIEHLAQPQRILEEVVRVLRQEGRLVLTTPFGVLHHHDHKQTFYPDDVIDLISEYLGVVEAEVADRYFRIIGVKGAATDPEIPERLRTSAFEAVRGIQEELASTRIERNRLQRESEKSATKLEGVSQELAELKEKADRRKDSVQEQLAEATEKAARAEAAKADLEKEVEEAKQEVDRAEQQLADLEAARRRARQLAERHELLEYRVSVARWKLAATKQRRWWQIGVLLGELRRRPWRLPMVLVELVRLMVTEQPRPPRPEPPESVRDSSAETEVVAETAAPLLPRHDLVGVGVVGPRTRELLDHELLFWRLNQEGWQERMKSLHPQIVVLEREEVREWSGEVIAQLQQCAAGLGARVVEIDPDRDGMSVHPRLHTPRGSHGRKDDHAVVDPTKRLVDDTPHDDEQGFVEAIQKHRVVVVTGAQTAPALARIAATSTPMIVQGVVEDPAFGLPATDEESSQSALAALTRSDSFAARLAHRDMRRAVRDHDFGVVLGDLLEQTPKVDVMVATMRPHRLENLLDNLGRQSYPNARLFLVTHGVEFDAVKVRDLADERGVEVAGVWSESEEVVLGEVFNRGFARTEADLVAKMDDDDFYGAEYLWDLVSAKDASRAEVAGKWAHYAYLEGPDTTVYRFRNYEHRFTDVVAISTLLMDRTVLDDEQFPPMPYGSGSVFLRAIGAAGAKVYAADRWNYVYFRGADGKRNTFPVSDLNMLSKSDVVCAGLTLDEVIA